MKKAILQKTAISGAAAIGVLAFASPAAFAWSGNSSGGNNYGPSYKSYRQLSSMQCYHMNNNYDSDWDGDWRDNCRPIMYGDSYYRMSSYSSNQYNSYHNNGCDRSNTSYGASEASYNSYH